MGRAQLRANLDHGVFGYPKLRQPLLWLHCRFREMATHGLTDPFDLGFARAQLNGAVAVPVHGPLVHHLAIVDVQHRDWHVAAIFLKNPAPAEFFHYFGLIAQLLCLSRAF